ncbi:hypothetical protein BDQ12DRAFT_673271 [Crucibulum laeve]|uniref:Uncharacterized protein n=1 Tax=Crucibulum laeve TaxID=68775 RepID=A0A5C3MHF9_9AGAR|nr:hypothetical protein BDQ12DRAFT_673271 [Crucibulum laeve]
MTTCQTFTATHIRHPWFDPPTIKRKHSSSRSSSTHASSPGAESDTSDDSRRAVKRRRCTVLEHGFAHLTLETPFSTNYSGSSTGESPSHLLYVHELPASQTFAGEASCSMDADGPFPPRSTMGTPPIFDVWLPSSVEEPSIPEVKMKSSSWYEPEPDRIVITDLDSFTDEEEEDKTPGVSINPALLDRIHARSFKSMPGYGEGQDSQALVLYKPMPRAAIAAPPAFHGGAREPEEQLAAGTKTEQLQGTSKEFTPQSTVEMNVVDEDAMDLDVEA